MRDISFYILSLKINGIKNIEKEVVFDFYKHDLSGKIDTKKYNVKAIYGENGVGKSGIICAVNILRNIALIPNYLNQMINKEVISEEINKRTNMLSIEIDFLCKVKKQNFIYNYGMSVRKINELLEIDCEYLKERKKSRKEYKDLFIVNKGKIEYIDLDVDAKEKVEELTRNILVSNSLISNVYFNSSIFNLITKEKNEKNAKVGLGLIATNSLFNSIEIYIDSNDSHEDYILKSYLSENRKAIEKYAEKAINPLFTIALTDTSSLYNQISINKNVMKKKEYKVFEEKINNLSNFIKVFKPDLNTIIIDRKVDKDLYICHLVMDYHDYKINAEYESNGIKKLIKLFNAFSLLSNGGIAFIDEMDANIHDVYLCKLIEYFANYSEGQLCFTTHNLSPMYLLSKRKKGIDVLSRDLTVLPIVSNGNRSAIKYYQNGMLDKSPFNIEPFDFLSIFRKGNI